MASQKPTMILKSKSDLSSEEIEALSDGEACRLIYSIRTTKAKDNRLQVCLTGFGASKKEQLINLAHDKGFKVVSSVTKKLDYLVGGEKAGSQKNEKAEPRGVQVINENQFINLFETDDA